jgi:hypothetical protein
MENAFRQINEHNIAVDSGLVGTGIIQSGVIRQLLQPRAIRVDSIDVGLTAAASLGREHNPLAHSASLAALTVKPS